MQRLVLVPRWSGDGRSDFYPWLTKELAERADGALAPPRVSSLLPSADAPTIEASVQRWREVVLDGVVRDTLVLAHSVGCQVTMRGLATLDEPVAGCLFVAGWFAVDEPWETILPWQQTPIDLEGARRAAGEVRVLLSDDDPFTRDAAATQAAFDKALGASVRTIAGAKHFNRSQEPEVLAELLALARGATP